MHGEGVLWPHDKVWSDRNVLDGRKRVGLGIEEIIPELAQMALDPVQHRKFGKGLFDVEILLAQLLRDERAFFPALDASLPAGLRIGFLAVLMADWPAA